MSAITRHHHAIVILDRLAITRCIFGEVAEARFGGHDGVCDGFDGRGRGVGGGVAGQFDVGRKGVADGGEAGVGHAAGGVGVDEEDLKGACTRWGGDRGAEGGFGGVSGGTAGGAGVAAVGGGGEVVWSRMAGVGGVGGAGDGARGAVAGLVRGHGEGFGGGLWWRVDWESA